MFVALQVLLAQVASLTTSMVANENGTITVTVIPKAKKDGEESAALNTPLSLTGTAEELDAEFASILASYTSKRSSLAEQLEATEAVLEAAKKESATKATKAVSKKPAAPAKAADAQPGSEKEAAGGEPSGTPSGEKSPEAASGNNLWD